MTIKRMVFDRYALPKAEGFSHPSMRHLRLALAELDKELPSREVEKATDAVREAMAAVARMGNACKVSVLV